MNGSKRVFFWSDWLSPPPPLFTHSTCAPADSLSLVQRRRAHQGLPEHFPQHDQVRRQLRQRALAALGALPGDHRAHGAALRRPSRCGAAAQGWLVGQHALLDPRQDQHQRQGLRVPPLARPRGGEGEVHPVAQRVDPAPLQHGQVRLGPTQRRPVPAARELPLHGGQDEERAPPHVIIHGRPPLERVVRRRARHNDVGDVSGRSVRHGRDGAAQPDSDSVCPGEASEWSENSENSVAQTGSTGSYRNMFVSLSSPL